MIRSDHPYNRLCRVLIRFMEAAVSLILAFLVIDVLWGVFTRFIVNEQSRWTEEVAIYLLIWVSLLGAAVTYADKGHLGVDYLVHKFDAKTRLIGEGAVHVIVLLFSIYGMLYGGYQLVSETLQAGQVSPAIGVPMSLVYSAVPISGVLFVLFAIQALLNLGQDEANTGGHDQPTEV